jgi:hypothetical protein
MLYLVPLARAGWQMSDGDGQAGLVSETLELALPQAHSVAVAAAASGGNDKGSGLGIARFAEAIPPAANTLDREGRSAVRWPRPQSRRSLLPVYLCCRNARVVIRKHPTSARQVCAVDVPAPEAFLGLTSLDNSAR